jgi:ubiquinone/menaquinone biosynthesis C-methylase UbiE
MTRSRGILGTYIVNNRENREESARLQLQDQMVTAGMGGVLPEQADPSLFKHILDVGCGTGGWLIEVAQTYPTIPSLVGVDVNKHVLAYAQKQAKAAHVSDRVRFQEMDALLALKFHDGYFDLVNQRFGASYIRTWEWSKLLSEYRRITRPGGVIRITELNTVTTGSPALLRLVNLLIESMYRSGHLSSPKTNGALGELPRLIDQHGVQDVQTQIYRLDYRFGTPEGQSFCGDMQRLFRTVVPFLQKWTQMPADYEIVYQHMLREMQEPDFVATWELLTVWGIK